MSKIFKSFTWYFLALLFPLICFGNGFGPGGPENCYFSEGIFRGEERLNLVVPKAFEGRTAKEWRNTKGLELFNCLKFGRTEGKVQLRGISTVFDFDYVKDRIDLQLFKSQTLRPGSNTCMECHGGKFSRTTFIVGKETTRMEPKPVRKGGVQFTIDDGLLDSRHAILNHWISPRIMARGDLKIGKLYQANNEFDMVAATFGFAGFFSHRFVWDGRLIISKAESFRKRKTIEGNISYRFGKRMEIMFGGGAFLDGYTHFGTGMSEMGAITVNLEKNDPQLMPNLFQRLKNDRFGYLRTALQYNYSF